MMDDSTRQPETTKPPKPTNTNQITTEFDWLVYADATFAGLSTLLPIPVVESVLEEFFRRRMPSRIARRRGRTLSRAVIRELNRKRSGGFLRGCLLWPIEQIIRFLRNLYRTVVYVLSVVEATDKLSHYWHRAFLLDYMVMHGHLDNLERAKIAAEAMREVLATTETSPTTNLAREVIEFAGHHMRGLVRSIIRFIRRKEETKEFKRQRQSVAARWAELSDYFIELATKYEQTFERLKSIEASAQSPPAGTAG
ncbi:MAG: hypothetical protein R6X18_10550 [Chloroflexota bacterium]|jgi:hypothetical protein